MPNEGVPTPIEESIVEKDCHFVDDKFHKACFYIGDKPIQQTNRQNNNNKNHKKDNNQSGKLKILLQTFRMGKTDCEWKESENERKKEKKTKNKRKFSLTVHFHLTELIIIFPWITVPKFV